MFRDALMINDETNLDDEEHWLSVNLRNLIRSFANFVIIDQYEIMLELIKGELSVIKKQILGGVLLDQKTKDI